LKKIKYILILLLTIYGVKNYAQQFKFQHYSVEEGLPQSQVYAMIQDSRGLLWIGTKGGGLSKFNGKEFTTFTKEEGLSGDQIYALFEDSKQNIWIGTGNGITHYNGINFTKHPISKKYDIMVSAIAEDHNNVIWAATNAGLYYYEKKQWVAFISNNTKLKYNISCLFVDSTGVIWTGNDNGLFKINEGHVSRYTNKGGLSSNKVRSINELNGELLVGTYGHGLNVYNAKGWSVLGKSNEIIHDIFIDEKKEIWVATQDNGAIKYNLKNKSEKKYNESKGLSANNVRIILQDSWHNMWFGTSGGGINKYHDQQFQHYNLEDGYLDSKFYSVLSGSDNTVWTGTGKFGFAEMRNDSIIYHNQNTDFKNYKCKVLFEDHVGNIWIGTEGKGIYIFNRSRYVQITSYHGLTDNWIRSITQDKYFNIWIATVSGISKLTPTNYADLKFTIKNFRQENGLPDDRINTLARDKENRMWFGTNNGHIGYIQNGKITNYGINDGIKRSVIKSITIDKHNQLWAATESEGLFIADLKSNFITFNQLKKKDGINSNNIYLLKFDQQGQLWLGAGGGVDRVSFTKSGEISDIKHFGQNEGFFGGETCTNAISVSKNGDLWIGTLDGLNRHTPTKSKINTIAPKLSMTNISLFYESITEGVNNWYNIDKTLNFNYNENHVSFKFEGVDLKNPEEVYYQFKLDGFENEWSPIEKHNVATYSNLPSGNYNFLVKAGNGDNIWTEPITIPFSILTPFWKSWWFISIIAISSLSIIFLIYRNRKRQLKEEKERLQLEKNMLEMEQKALRLQMNPHFIFNAMNTVQALIAKKDEKAARYYLAKFSKLMRKVLENSRNTLITIHDEIEALENYLNLEQLSNEGKFDYEIIVDENIQTDAYGIPPLLLQPFAENSIVHGLKELQHRGKITIKFEWKETFIECSVSDNGRGRLAAKEVRHQKSSYHKSTALVLTQERLASLSDDLQVKSFEIIDMKKPSGTKVILRIPVIEVF
jgi:ligand-binding sensor domain-containing protein